MSKKPKTVQTDGAEEVIESKKPQTGFVGARVSKKRYRQILARITDPLIRGAMRRMYFNQDRKDVKRPLGAKK